MNGLLATMNTAGISQVVVPLCAVLLAVIGTVTLVWCKKSLAGTTLVASWWWGLFSIWAIAGVEIFLAIRVESAISVWPVGLRYSTAVTMFCPLMAALGARRPQYSAWQFIVFSLWCVLALPAAETVFVRASDVFEIQGARSWFLVGLIVVGLANSLPTRFWLASLLTAAAQTVLLLPYLPLVQADMGRWAAPAALLLFTTALGMVASEVPALRKSVTPLDRVWLDFRDQFGTLWSLRVAEQINSVAALFHWPIVLKWGGLRQTNGEPMPSELTPEVAAALRLTLDNVLRRFVSAEWLDARLDGG